MHTLRITCLAALLLALPALTQPGSLADETQGPPPGLITSLRGHREAVYGIAFTPDGKQLLTASGDPSIKVWDAATGKEIKTFAGQSGHRQLVLAVAVSPDGSAFATGSSDNTLKVWDFPTSKHLNQLTLPADATAVAATNDGSRLAAGTKDGKLKLFSTAPPAKGRQAPPPVEVAAHEGAVTSLAFS